MLKVIVNVCPSARLKEIAGESSVILTDAELYKMLNGEEKFGPFMYDQNSIEGLVDAIVEASKTKDFVIHSFNPGLLNWFEDSVAISSFYVLNEQGEPELLFSYKSMLEKLEALGPGEAVVDTNFKRFSEIHTEKV